MLQRTASPLQAQRLRLISRELQRALYLALEMGATSRFLILLSSPYPRAVITQLLDSYIAVIVQEH